MGQEHGVDAVQRRGRRQRRVPPQVRHAVAQQRVAEQPHAVEIEQCGAVSDPGHLRHGGQGMLRPRAGARTRRRRRARHRRGSGRAAGPAASRRRHGRPALGCSPALARARAGSGVRRRRGGTGRRGRGLRARRRGGAAPAAAGCRAASRCSARRARSRRCSRCGACAKPSRACARRSTRVTWTTARALAARDLVSRDTAQLDASELSGAAIQSLAENLSDSVVAPLLAYAAGGLPGAAAYRALNTADAMWGYRTPELLHRGRAAARADDVANLVPARLTALLIAARAPQRGAACADRAARPRPGALAERRLADGGDGRRRSACASSSAIRTRSTPRRRAPGAADIGRALGVVGG